MNNLDVVLCTCNPAVMSLNRLVDYITTCDPAQGNESD